MLRITDDFRIDCKKMPVQEFLLPANKKLDCRIEPLQAVVLSISRDAFSLSMAIERLEDPDNRHARHLLIDRSGHIYQFVRLSQPINHLPGSTPSRIHNCNSIAIELVNAGKLFNCNNRNGITLHGHGQQGAQRWPISRSNLRACKASNGALYTYEVIYHQQFYSLYHLVGLLRQRFADLRVIDCERWPQLHRYALSPNFPRRRLDAVGTN